MKQTLTKEQSQRLIELGVSTEKASSFISNDVSYSEVADGKPNYFSPTFTIGDLLNILPKEITRNEVVFKISISGFLQFWNIGYYDDFTKLLLFSANGEELIDILLETAIWCIDNGYIKTEKL